MYRSIFDGADWSRSNLDIAKALGVHYGSVSNARRRLRIPRRKPGPEPSIRQCELPSILVLLRSGVKKREIARRYGVSTMSLRRRLRGVPGCSEASLLAWREGVRNREARERGLREAEERKAIKESLRAKPACDPEPVDPKAIARKRIKAFLAAI